MRIKKMYQGTVPENKILNTYSESQTDVYSCDYVNGVIKKAVAETYSTEEVKTNKVWIDGKFIYRRAFSDYLGNIKTQLTQAVLNHETITKISGYAYSIYNQWWPIPSTYHDGGYNTYTYWSNTGIGIELGSYFDANAPVKLIIEYTKTTD